MPWARMSNSVSFSSANSRRSPSCRRAAPDERRAVGAVEHEVLGDRELADEAVLVAVLGDEADAGVEDLAHATADAARSPSRVIEPVTRVLQADDRLGELGLAVALHAGDGEDLAGPHVEARRR